MKSLATNDEMTEVLQTSPLTVNSALAASNTTTPGLSPATNGHAHAHAHASPPLLPADETHPRRSASIRAVDLERARDAHAGRRSSQRKQSLARMSFRAREARARRKEEEKKMGLLRRSSTLLKGYTTGAHASSVGEQKVITPLLNNPALRTATAQVAKREPFRKKREKSTIILGEFDNLKASHLQKKKNRKKTVVRSRCMGWENF